MNKHEINPGTAFHSLTENEAIAALGTDLSTGLSREEAARRLSAYGRNELEENKKRSPLLIFLAQFKSPIVLLLFIAAGLSFLFREWLDGIAILVVLLINALVGFYMEYKAERSMEALKKLSMVPAHVIREGIMTEVDAAQLVPGDIIYLEAGDLVPADARILQAAQLQADEAALTGESIPSEKATGRFEAGTPLAERFNTLFKGTYITRGNTRAAVTSTGMRTELGKIAKLVQSAESSATPLEKKIEQFSKRLIWIAVGLVVFVFLAGMLHGNKLLQTLETSIALAVAAIPEGLPIVATMALAQGMLKMAKKNVIVKKLSAVETLGGTNVICTDKTGTLTQNRIEVEVIVTPGATYRRGMIEKNNDRGLEHIFHLSVLCNTASMHKSGSELKEIGDPLEIGLLKFAEAHNYDALKLRDRYPKRGEEPFSSETRIMATLHGNVAGNIIYAKGAVEELLVRCTHHLQNNSETLLDNEAKQHWLREADQMAEAGYRVIAGAYRNCSGDPSVLSEQLVFTGLIGMIDPPREDVFNAILECRSAGINVIMITGDHPSTAGNIARQLNITSNTGGVMRGTEMRDYELLTAQEKERWITTNVFARVTPKQKLDLVTVLQEKDYIVGMTGDGINDAPALKKADIGIAMGLRGTQVAQEVADMVLKDDAFSSIVEAIRQGRIIFENIRKFVVYLLSCNLSELLVIALASIMNLHFQLVPLQILFINLITDVLPALALGVTEGSGHIMKRPPKNAGEPIINRKRWFAIMFYATAISFACLVAVLISHTAGHREEGWDPAICNNVLFFTLIFSQLLHVFNMSTHRQFFSSEVIRSKYVWGAVACSMLAVLIAYAIPAARKALALEIISSTDWLIVAGASIFSLLIIQAGKKLRIVL